MEMKAIIDGGPREFHCGDNLVENGLSWICTAANNGEDWASEDPFIHLEKVRHWSWQDSDYSLT